MTTPSDPVADAAELLRREALGAFAHEIRTPLTSIRMVLELAKRLGTDGKRVLDSELGTMLDASVDDLERFADELQEFSRLERGRIVLSGGPCELAAAVESARELAGPDVQLAGTGGPEGLKGPWDAGRLVRAIAGFGQAANRIGNGSGIVDLGWAGTPTSVELRFASGAAGGADRPIGADAGFAFFRSRQYILAMGGTVDWRRAERFVEIRVGLPLGLAYTR
jgi:signal transduction histidine kinase